jgi:type II secretory pathway component PulJ
MKGQRGFSLVEALLACALLGVVLTPALATFRAHLAAVSRMQARLRVDRLLDERLALAEARLRAADRDAAVSGYLPDGLMVYEQPPEALPSGPLVLWHLALRAADPGANYERQAVRWLLLPPAERASSGASGLERL